MLSKIVSQFKLSYEIYSKRVHRKFSFLVPLFSTLSILNGILSSLASKLLAGIIIYFAGYYSFYHYIANKPKFEKEFTVKELKKHHEIYTLSSPIRCAYTLEYTINKGTRAAFSIQTSSNSDNPNKGAFSILGKGDNLKNGKIGGILPPGEWSLVSILESEEDVDIDIKLSVWDSKKIEINQFLPWP